jgi:hypothetical protein
MFQYQLAWFCLIYDVHKAPRCRGRLPKVTKDGPATQKRKGSSVGRQAKRHAQSRQGADPVEQCLGKSNTDGAEQALGEEYQFMVGQCHLN